MTSYFVTATGTDIGKTFVACGLLHGARAAGLGAHGVKPVACGIGHAQEGDVKQLLEAGGEAVAEVSPWWFKAPLSPDMAAAREGRTIDLPELTAWTCNRICPNRLTLVEGVGGVMVPLTADHTVRDWMVALGLPVILVAGSYLGTLNHTLAALEALRAARLKIAALVISESAQSPVPLAETKASLANFACDIPLIITQPRVSSWKEATAIHALARELM